MSKWFRCLGVLVWGLASAGGLRAAPLTAQETRWLDAVSPVRAYAQELGLPLDIVVQPQEASGTPPLAMAYVDGHCKLVFSMRGNAAVDEALAGLDGDFAGLAIETMAAHELAHCWRYTRGDWHVWPAGFSIPGGEPGSLMARHAAMGATRREEGYADLVALGYVARQHPAAYRRVHAWLTGVRADQPVEGAHHDTRVWVKLAADPVVWAAPAGLFERAEVLWRDGL